MKITMIFGPPGTGKTKTLIDILDKEIKDGVPLNKIAFVAFSRKAAHEAQDRVKSHFLCDDKELANIRTIHSMTFRATGASAAQMMDPGKYQDFGVKSGFSLKGYYSVDEGFTSKDDDFIGIEQLYRNNKRYCSKILDGIDHRRFVIYMQLYKKYKDTFRYLDFTDLLDLYIQKDKQEDVDVAIIDEAQDLTTLQWRVVMKAFRNCKRMYVAGDDLQAIFTWAGADVDAFLQIKGESRILEYSFRLPRLLIHEAKKISNLVNKKVEKIYHGEDREAYFTYIADLRELSFRKGESYYLLARNNFSLKNYVDYCIVNGVRFSLRGKDFLTKSDISRVKSREDLSDWEPGKIDYVNRLIGQGTLEDAPLINIGTIHSVKGGEADHVVIMTDVSRGVMKQLEWDEDSEHRNYYVALTRAKKGVTVVLPSSKYNYPYLK